MMPSWEARGARRSIGLGGSTTTEPTEIVRELIRLEIVAGSAQNRLQMAVCEPHEETEAQVDGEGQSEESLRSAETIGACLDLAQVGHVAG